MNENEEFAIKFADWLSENCDTVDHKGKWLYYSVDGIVKKNTRQLLKIFKDEMEGKN